MTSKRKPEGLTPEQQRRRAEILESVRANDSVTRLLRESAEYFANGGEPIVWDDIESKARRGVQ
jgi:hypothetical protein